MKLSSLTVGQRLTAGFSLVMVVMALVTAFGAYRVNQVEHRLTVINDVNGVKERYAINFRGSVHDGAISLRDVVLAFLLAALLAAAAAGMITRSITTPMAQTAAVFRAVADGDLTHRIDASSSIGLGELGRQANRALERFRAVIREIVSGADRLVAASSRVGGSAAAVAQAARASATQVEAVAQAAGLVSVNVQTVAAGAGQMSASIAEDLGEHDRGGERRPAGGRGGRADQQDRRPARRFQSGNR